MKIDIDLQMNLNAGIWNSQVLANCKEKSYHGNAIKMRKAAAKNGNRSNRLKNQYWHMPNPERKRKISNLFFLLFAKKIYNVSQFRQRGKQKKGSQHVANAININEILQ